MRRFEHHRLLDHDVQAGGQRRLGQGVVVDVRHGDEHAVDGARREQLRRVVVHLGDVEALGGGGQLVVVGVGERRHLGARVAGEGGEVRLGGPPAGTDDADPRPLSTHSDLPLLTTPPMTPRTLPIAVVAMNPIRDAHGAEQSTDRGRHADRGEPPAAVYSETNEGTPMISTLNRRRGGIVVAIAALSLASAGVAAATAPPGSEPMTSEPMMSEPMTSEPMAAGPTGAACAAVPTEGEGSVDGMADDPAATAASNNPLLSTLVTAVDAAGLVDTLNGEVPSRSSPRSTRRSTRSRPTRSRVYSPTRRR